MDGASKSMLSLSVIHYHPERDEPVLQKHAELQNGRKFVVSTTPDQGSNVLLKKVSRPLQKTLRTVNSLGFGYVMFSPKGLTMDHIFPAFPDEWEEVSKEPREYQVIGEVSLEAESPEGAAEEFIQKVGDGQIVVTVRNVSTDSVSDVYLGDVVGAEDSTISSNQPDQSDDSDQSSEESGEE